MSRPPAQHLPADRLIVRVPMEFRRRGGKKEIITPDGEALGSPNRSPRGTPAPRAHPLLVALARAYRWQEMIESGEVPSLTALAATLGVQRTYVARVIRLTGLAPGIVEEMLRGHESEGTTLRALHDVEVPVVWTEQRNAVRPTTTSSIASHATSTTEGRTLPSLATGPYSGSSR